MLQVTGRGRCSRYATTAVQDSRAERGFMGRLEDQPVEALPQLRGMRSVGHRQGRAADLRNLMGALLKRDLRTPLDPDSQAGPAIRCRARGKTQGEQRVRRPAVLRTENTHSELAAVAGVQYDESYSEQQSAQGRVAERRGDEINDGWRTASGARLGTTNRKQRGRRWPDMKAARMEVVETVGRAI